MKNFSFLGVLFCVGAITIFVIGYSKEHKLTTASKYPERAITCIVPFVAGGSTDMMARSMEKLAIMKLGHPFIINNMPGGSGTLGWNELAGANPDGYTIGYVASGIILQPLYTETRYHYPTALEPLAQVVSIPAVIAVSTNQPWESIDDIIKYAKEHPGEVKYGHPGLGSATHVVGELFAKEAGIKITQVPFRGESEALAALLGKHVQLMVTTLPAIREHVKAGTVRVLAVAANQRMTDPEVVNVPTFKEQNLNVEYSAFFGIGAPKQLPQEVKDKLAEGLKEIINDPEFKRNMDALGLTVDYLGPEEFKARWISENDRNVKFIKESGIAELVAAQKN